MGINIYDEVEMQKVKKSVRYSWTQSSPARERRNHLIRIYEDREDYLSSYIQDFKACNAYVNLFAQYVRGLQLSLAYNLPKWSVDARQAEGVGFDTRIQLLLQYYTPMLNLVDLLRTWSMDCAFGDAVARVSTGIAPKGVKSPIAPRVYRVPPNNFIKDWSAENLETCSWLGELYLVPLKDAQNNPMFNPYLRNTIQRFRFETDNTRSYLYNTDDAFAEEQCRLLDLYLPLTNVGGVILTFDCPNDSFGNIGTQFLAATPTSINPYEVCQLMQRPDSVEELARLLFLKELHLLANDSLSKAALQMRQSKRNPVGKIGDELDLSGLLDAPDGEAAFVTDKSNIDIYTLPGPDNSVIGMGRMAQELFSEQGGNVEVALGISPGARTARQSQAMLQQVQSASAYDRMLFDRFVAGIGKKIATLAFQSEIFEFNFRQRIPGTNLNYNVSWGPEQTLPRVGEVNDYSFDVVPSSSMYRSPQEKLSHLQQASQGIMGWMQAAAQGAPVNMEYIMKEYSEAFDLLTCLPEWWSGEKPTPIQQTQNTYSSMAAPPEGSDIRYQGVDGGGGGADYFSQPAEGGFAVGPQ
jgi:hypothetical protein